MSLRLMVLFCSFIVAQSGICSPSLDPEILKAERQEREDQEIMPGEPMVRVMIPGWIAPVEMPRRVFERRIAERALPVPMVREQRAREERYAQRERPAQEVLEALQRIEEGQQIDAGLLAEARRIVEQARRDGLVEYEAEARQGSNDRASWCVLS